MPFSSGYYLIFLFQPASLRFWLATPYAWQVGWLTKTQKPSIPTVFQIWSIIHPLRKDNLTKPPPSQLLADRHPIDNSIHCIHVNVIPRSGKLPSPTPLLYPTALHPVGTPPLPSHSSRMLGMVTPISPATEKKSATPPRYKRLLATSNWF